MIVGNPIIMILKAILNWFRLRRDYIANAVDKIPPEIKDALIVWYSPVKQKLSNYDVIESYSEDFTKWTKNGNVTSAATVNNNSIVINGSIKGASIFKKSNTSMQSINIIASGVENGDNVEYRCVKNGVLQYIPIVNGINKLPASELTENPDFNIGFVLNINSTGIINLKQLPTSILKDFSGNGKHAYLYGGKGKLNSGMGLYKVDFTTYINKNNILDIKPNSFITNAGASYINSYYSQIANNIPTYNIKVANLNGSIKYSYKDTDYTDLSVIIEKDGTYNLPISYKVNENKPTGFSINSSTKVTITQIPDYPDQLCYNGRMYAVTYGFPTLTNYTVIADRTWFKDKVNFWSYFISKRDAFDFEIYNSNVFITRSFYRDNNITLNEDKISYQNKTSYNGKQINFNNGTDTKEKLYIGTTPNKPGTECFIGCHGDILLFNRTLTDDELDLVKEHFFGIVRIKDALMTTDKKYLVLANNNVT